MTRADHRRTLERLEAHRAISNPQDGQDHRTELLAKLKMMAVAVGDDGNTWDTYDPVEIVAACDERMVDADADLRETQAVAAELLAGRYPRHCDTPERRRSLDRSVTSRADGALARTVTLGGIRGAAAADLGADRPVGPTPTHRPDGAPIAWRARIESMSIAELVALRLTRNVKFHDS